MIKMILSNPFCLTITLLHNFQNIHSKQRMKESDVCFFYNHKIPFIIISDHNHIFKNANREKQNMPKCRRK